MTGGKPVADLVLGIDARQQHDAIDMLPSIAQTRLQGQLIAHPGEAHDLMRRVLFEIRGELNRRRGRQIAEADIGQIRPFRQVHLQHHVKHRPRRIDSESAHHAGLKARDVEAQ